MIKDFRKVVKILKKIKKVSLVFFDILQLPHTAMSNSEKLTHPNVQTPPNPSWQSFSTLLLPFNLHPLETIAPS